MSTERQKMLAGEMYAAHSILGWLAPGRTRAISARR